MSRIAITLLSFLFASLSIIAAAKSHSDEIEKERIRKRNAILRQITGASQSDYVIDVTRLGARGDGVKDCKPAFDKAMKMAEKRGGARVVVPEGVYYVRGPIHFVSGVCLELKENATIRFAPETELYLPVVPTSWEGTLLYNYSPFIYGRGLHDVSIVGRGTIDGNAGSTFATWKSEQRKGLTLSRDMNHNEVSLNERVFGRGFMLRPQLIQFYECKNITIEGVLIKNSPFWCLHLLKSENIICRGLRYDAKLVNNDGIDPEYSRNILIENIEFNNGDDNVAIKSGRDNDGRNIAIPSENIIIRNCRFKGLHAVVLGSEMSAGVRDVFVENCTFGGYCKRGIYIKTNPDRGGFIRNLYVSNCEFDEVEDLFYATSMYAGEGLDNNYFTTVENIYVDGLRCRKARNAGLVLQGTEPQPIKNVMFRNIEIGEVANAVSFDNTIDVVLENCHLGGKAGVPTQASAKDNLFR